MARILLLLLVATSLTAVGPETSAQSFSRVATRPISNQAIRSVLRARSAVNTLMIEAIVPPEQPSWTLQLGALYEDTGGDDRHFAVPAELRLDLAGGATSFLLDVLAYETIETRSTTLDGTGDPSLTALHSFHFDDTSLIAGGGASVPSGSAVGTSHASQYAIGILAHAFANDAFARGGLLQLAWIQLWTIATHSRTDDSSPAAPMTWTMKGFYYQALPRQPKGTDVFAVAAYSYQRNAGRGVSAGLGTDFAFPGSARGDLKGVTGTFTVLCPLSGGSGHCGSAELDVQLSF